MKAEKPCSFAVFVLQYPGVGWQGWYLWEVYPTKKKWAIRGHSWEVMGRLQESLKAVGLLACHWEDVSALRERLGLEPIDKDGYSLCDEQ